MVSFPFGREIVLLRRSPSTTDDYGDQTGVATEETVIGAFAPGGSAEANGTGVVISHPTVYLPPGIAHLSAIDAVKVDGVLYEVDGLPIVWQNPMSGWTPGVEVRLVARESE